MLNEGYLGEEEVEQLVVVTLVCNVLIEDLLHVAHDAELLRRHKRRDQHSHSLKR